MKNWYNQRAAYSDYEIASMIRKEMQKQNISKKEFCRIYSPKYDKFNEQILEYMLDGKTYYNTIMLEIASEFLNIDFDKLVEVLEDEETSSFRCSTDDDTNEDINNFCEIVNILFAEMIENINLSNK